MRGSSQGSSYPDSGTRTELRVRGFDSDTPAQQWRVFASLAARAGGMRLFNPDTGDFDGAAVPVTPVPPPVPAGLVIFSPADNGRKRSARTHWMPLDFDAKPGDGASPEVVAAARAAAARDADDAMALVRECGGVAISDVNPATGGRHVYVLFAAGETYTKTALHPLLTELRERFATLDLAPLLNPVSGCITIPGSRCKHDERHRELVDVTVEQVRDAFTVNRSDPNLPARLLAALRPPQLSLDDVVAARPPASTEAAEAGMTATAVLPPELVSRAPRPAWMTTFCQHGQHPSRHRSPSEARLAVLEAHALRGYSREQVWALMAPATTTSTAGWPGMWAGYADRHDRRSRFRSDWERAFSHAHTRASATHSQTRYRQHQHVPKHTAPVVKGSKWHLAAARKWILLSGLFTHRELWTALSVVQALAVGISLTGTGSVANGHRWLAVGAGITSERATLAVLKKLRAAAGSPVQWIGEHTIDNGDRYRLVDGVLDGRVVEPALWEVYAAKTDPVDPVWRDLGRSAWWVYTVLAAIEETPRGRVSTRYLADMARLAPSTVDDALAALEAESIVDRGYGWVARTGRTVRQLGDLTAHADERAQARIARHRTERSLWKQFWGIIAADPELSALAATIGRYGIDNSPLDPVEAWTALHHSLPPPEPSWCDESATERAIHHHHNLPATAAEDFAYTAALLGSAAPAVADWSGDAEHGRALDLCVAELGATVIP